MIIPNLVVGKDKNGYDLKCGDLCNFKVNLHRPGYEGVIETMKGMIVYDEDSYAFAFETLDSFARILLIHRVEEDSIEKMFEASVDNFKTIPNGKSWKSIYNKNVCTLKLWEF